MLKKRLSSFALKVANWLPIDLSVEVFRAMKLPSDIIRRRKPAFHSDPIIDRERLDSLYVKQFPEGFEGKPKGFSKLDERFNQIKDELKGSIAEIGCADGYFSRRFAQLGHRTVGVDFSTHFVNLANRYKRESRIKNVNFVLGRAERLPLENNSFETVFLGEILEHVKDVDRVLSEAQRIISPGGKFIITLPTHLMGSPDHRRTITPRQLRKKLANFANVKKMFLLGATHYCCIAETKKGH